jgi:hypothetical protein
MNTKSIIFTLLITLTLAACAPATPIVPTPDILAVRTSAAYTVVAEFTLTAAAFTPTFTPEPPTEMPTPVPPPTETATIAYSTDPTQIALGTPGAPVALCDDYSFDLGTLDVTIPDGTFMTPGQEFDKTWKIKNTGECTWGDGYTLIYAYGGDKMNGQPVPFAVVIVPGQEIDVTVKFKAPAKIGEYTSVWQMVNPKGIPFGDKEHFLLVKIIVQ